MSDALIRGVRANFPLQGVHWQGMKMPVDSWTVLTGYADGGGTIRFRWPLGSWKYFLTTLTDLSDLRGGGSFVLRYSLLNSQAACGSVVIGLSGGAASWLNGQPVMTDPWGFAYVNVDVPVESGVTGGAVGVLYYPPTYTFNARTYDNSATMNAKFGHPNLPWTAGAAVPSHQAVINPLVASKDATAWDRKLHWQYRIFSPVMGASTALDGGGYAHRPHPELVPFVDDGSYAWLCLPNTCGEDGRSPWADDGTSCAVYAATHVYARTLAANSRQDRVGPSGRTIRQKKGSAPFMGLAEVPVAVVPVSSSVSYPPFKDTFATTETIPEDSTMPWYFAGYITVEDGRAYCSFRIPFQSIADVMGYKDRSGWSWAPAIHEDGTATDLPELLLMNDGSGTNLLSGVKFDSSGGSASYISHDPMGISVRALLSSVPSIGEHACFVKVKKACIRVNSPAANGNGDAPPSEEPFE